MKKLDDFRLVKDFISSQGIEFTIACVAVDEKAWDDLVFLAREWKREIDEIVAEKEAKLAAMTPDEIEQMETEAEEEAKLEKERVLFHSSGHRPERS